MKLKYFFLLLFLCLYNYSFSCDCKLIDRENMVEIGLKHEIVFYGEVVKVDSIKRTYTFKIIELFKGKHNSQFITQKYYGNCSVIPSLKQLWIVYANFNDDKTIEVSGCSLSKGFKPNGNNFMAPPPPPKDAFLNAKDQKTQLLWENFWELQINYYNLEDWIYEIEKLRTYKASQNKNLEEKTTQKIETYSQYIIISLIVNILLFLSLLFVILKKKNFVK